MKDSEISKTKDASTAGLAKPALMPPTPPASATEQKRRDLLLEPLDRDQAAVVQAYRDNPKVEVPY